MGFSLDESLSAVTLFVAWLHVRGVVTLLMTTGHRCGAVPDAGAAAAASVALAQAHQGLWLRLRSVMR